MTDTDILNTARDILASLIHKRLTSEPDELLDDVAVSSMVSDAVKPSFYVQQLPLVHGCHHFRVYLDFDPKSKLPSENIETSRKFCLNMIIGKDPAETAQLSSIEKML